MKKFLSLALALVMTMSLVTISAGAKDFTDSSKITYGDAVKVMSAIEVVDGYAQGDFRPTNTLTRGAAAKIICNMVLGPTTAGALPTSVAPFKDVPAGSTFAGYIAYCSQKGIINGYADGTFRPSGTLNGYAFMKMLLGALGYDGKIEGFTGANWSVNVAKLAMGIGLDDGLTEGFNGSKAVTREEACLYAFNTLQADMVEYSTTGSSITVGGVEIVTNPSKAESVTTNGTSNTICDERVEDGANVDTVQFGERYFKDLEKSATHDNMDRPATKWVYDDEKVTVIADKADATYTKAVEEKDLYKALNISTHNAFDVYTDGVAGATNVAISNSATTDLAGSGRGVLVEVYYDKDSADNRIIITNTKIDSIDDVDTNDDDERIVSIGSMDYVTNEFEEDDMVLFTVDDNAANDEKIQTMVAAEKLTGELTKKAGSKYTIDGTVYELSESAYEDIDESVTVKSDVDFYLDSYGYIIKLDVAEDSTTVENLALVLESGDSRGTDWAKLLFSDGKTKVVDITKKYTNYEKNDLVSFKVEDDGLYKLTEKTDKKTDAAASFEKGNTYITFGGAKVKVDSKTVFVYAVTSSDDTDYTVYTGYKSAASFNAASGANVTGYVPTGKTAASVVFVQVAKADLHSTSADLTFLAVQDDLSEIDEGDGVKYYEFQAVVNGEIKTVKIDSAYVGTNPSTQFALFDGVKVLNQVSYDSDDLGDLGNAVTTGTDPYDTTAKDYYTANKSEKESNGVLTFKQDSTAYTLSYTADDVKVFFVDGDEISEGKVGDIREDDNRSKDPYGTIYYTLDDGDVDLVVIVKK